MAQPNSNDVTEFILSGEKLEKPTNNFDKIEDIGRNLYIKNREFIREQVKDNWFVVIEPVSGTLFASADQLTLFQYAKNKFADRLFYSVGLLKENLLYAVR